MQSQHSIAGASERGNALARLVLRGAAIHRNLNAVRMSQWDIW
jgi:hypothetical protein